MEIFSMGLEIKALRTITSNEIKKGLRVSMLGRLTDKHFSSEVTKKTYRRLMKLLESRSIIMDWDDVLEDPNLSVDFREALRESDESPAKGLKGFERIYDSLEQYRKRRHLMNLGREIAKVLDGSEEEFDEDEFLLRMAEGLNQASGGSKQTEKIYTFGGKKSNALAFAEQTLNNPTEKLYKTGYKEYDKRNGGLPTTGVMLLGASTSGGKSVFSMNLADRMVQANDIHALKVTLEMTAEQEMNRMLAMISGVDFWKIKQNKLTEKEKKEVLKAAKAYDKMLTKKKGRNSFTSPERGMSIDDVLYMSTAYGAQLMVIDYAGLLEGVDDGDQWKNLGAIVRKAKVHTQRTGQLVIILVQIDDDTGKIRYAKAMREHADVVWIWNYSDPEIREMKILPIQVIKVRDGELFELPLKDVFEKMRVDDSDEVSRDLTPDENKGEFRKGKNGFKKKENKELADLKPNRRAGMLVSAAYDDGDKKGGSKKKKRKRALE